MSVTMSAKKKSLAETHPAFAAEWHPTKNGDLRPDDLSYGSRKKVWWSCSFGHEWETAPNHRTAGRTGCPFCRGNRVDANNSLAAVFPEVAEEWHPTRNDSLTPADIRPKSGEKVWWLCESGHEWAAIISNRTRGNGCPYCAGQALLPLRRVCLTSALSYPKYTT